METATLAQPPPGGDPSFAIGHVAGQPIEGGWHVYPELAAAGMWCTAADLLALHRQVMQRPAEWLRPEASTPNSSYGLGIDVAGQIIGHSGGNHGFVSWVGGSGDGVHCVAVLTNGDDGRLVRQAAALISEE